MSAGDRGEDAAPTHVYCRLGPAVHAPSGHCFSKTSIPRQRGTLRFALHPNSLTLSEPFLHLFSSSRSSRTLAGFLSESGFVILALRAALRMDWLACWSR